MCWRTAHRIHIPPKPDRLEGHVKIDHYYVYFIQNGSPIAVHSLEYTIFPEKDMNTVINDL